MRLADIRNRARSDLHDHMSVPSIYVPPNGGANSIVSVRVHQIPVVLDEAGSISDIETRIIFKNSALPVPKRLGIFSLNETTAYRIERIPFVDGITRTVSVVQLDQSQIGDRDLPVPEVN